ncbi:hypothetical protein MRX96_046702 [Rhipicephalus microplus]
MLEITGENFTANLRVWLGNVEVETIYRSAECLLCALPNISTFREGWQGMCSSTQMPISLVSGPSPSPAPVHEILKHANARTHPPAPEDHGMMAQNYGYAIGSYPHHQGTP